MAGRVPRENHRGKPRQLGHPGPGCVRRLTVNEEVATGLTRAALVLGSIDGAFVLFRSVGRYEWKLVAFEEHPDAYTELMKFWRERK